MRDRDDTAAPPERDAAALQGLQTAPYGAWASPISARSIAEAGIGLSGLQVAGDVLFWTESRPMEEGRNVVVRRGPDGVIDDVTPPGLNARTLVHEYGGGAVAVHGSPGGITLIFSNFDDQRLYRQDLGVDGDVASGGGNAHDDISAAAPHPITPKPPAPRALRYADARLTPDGARVLCVRERHEAGEVLNELVAVPTDGSGDVRILATGRDFYAAPRISPDGSRLAWLCWDHPSMPWDGTELWVADLGPEGLTGARRVAGSADESVVQPAWSRDGRLHFVSDRSGWWNLYRIEEDTAYEGDATQAAAVVGSGAEPLPATPMMPMTAELAKPSWVFGLTNHAFLPDGSIVAFWSDQGVDRLGVIAAEPASAPAAAPVAGPAGALAPLPSPFTAFGSVAALGDAVAVLGGSPTQGPTIALLDPTTGDLQEIRRSSKINVDPGYVSVPEPIEFPTSYDPGSVAGPLLEELTEAGGRLSAYALYYPPANKDFRAPEGERPPLLVISHGGPTSAAEALFSPSIQFWTSRGIGVVDVNYGGSTGHGRAYRERLKGNWGVVDTVDCISAARYLVERGDVDEARLAIRGGSAGGYTTLNALTRHRAFAAGASYFGLADLERFATGGTHKFESRYLDGLVGPYPERADVYRERSPITHVDEIACPVILLQGLEDAIVPPEQAEVIVAALRRKGLPYAYLAFEGEQHGFRKAANIVRSLEAELYFYGRVFNFVPADAIAPVEIENLP